MCNSNNAREEHSSPEIILSAGTTSRCLNWRRTPSSTTRCSWPVCRGPPLTASPTISPVTSPAGVVSTVRPADEHKPPQTCLNLHSPNPVTDRVCRLQLVVPRQLDFSRPSFRWWLTACAVEATGGAARPKPPWFAQEEKASQHVT